MVCTVANEQSANGWVRNHFVLTAFKALGCLPVVSTLGLVGGVKAVVMFRWMEEHPSLPVGAKMGIELLLVGSAILAGFPALLFDLIVYLAFAML